MSKRKTHTIEFKQTVLSYIYENESSPRTSYAAEKKFKAEGHKVNKQSIHGWMANREKIMESLGKGKRLEGAGRRPLLGEELEEFLNALIIQERNEGNRVTGCSRMGQRKCSGK